MKNVTLIVALLALALGAKAGTFSMVQINPGVGYCDNIFVDSNKYVYGAGDLKHFARMNGLLYFVGTDQPYNDELWVTDGTQAGTHKVIEINPNGGAHIGDLRVVGNKLMFLANESTSDQLMTEDYDLFVSDGTAAGTVRTGDLNLSVNTFLSEQSAGMTNGKLIFCSNRDVLVSDGTSAGTKSLAPLSIISYTGANGYCELNNNVFFIVNSDIWKSDGTAAGTMAVRSVAAGNWPLAYASQIKAFDNKLYIIGAKSGEGDEAYTFDGTESGAVTKVVSAPGGNTYASGLTVCGDALWFTAYDTISYNLYKLDRSTGVQRITEVNGALSFANGKVYYPNLENNGYEVIDAVTNAHSSFGRSNLTFNGSGFSVYPNSVMAMGDKVFYLAYDSATGQQVMCITDGTSAGIWVEMPAGVTVAHPFDYVAGCGIIDVFDFTYYDNKIVIPANFNNAGRELWFYEAQGLVSGIKEESQSSISLYPNPASDVISIDLGKDYAASTDMEVQLLDINGRMIAGHQVINNKVTLPTSALANGSYIAAVKKGGEVVAHRKVIVAH